MRVADITTAVVLFLLGAVVLVDAIRLGIGWGTDGPKSGFFPFWLAALMMTSCVVIATQALRSAAGTPFVTREQAAPVLKVIVPATAMVAATEVVGIYVASVVYIAFYMRWIGRHRWLTIAALALGIPLVTFVVFEHWFLVPLPKGPLETWLGY
jgi:putative tricarboxylic transport membrane protein